MGMAGGAGTWRPLVVFYADEAFLHVNGLHAELQSDENLFGMLEHEPVVGCQVGFALHGVDDDAFGLAAGRGRELDVAGEGGTAHADDAGVLYLVDDCLAVQVWTVREPDEFGTSVDALFPFVAFHIHIDGHAACSAGIQADVNFRHFAADAAMDGCTDEAAGLAQEGADLHFVAFLDDGLCRSSDMLEHAEDGLAWQCCFAYGTCSRQLVFCGMNSAYLKCLHIYSAFEGSASFVGVF